MYEVNRVKKVKKKQKKLSFSTRSHETQAEICQVFS